MKWIVIYFIFMCFNCGFNSGAKYPSELPLCRSNDEQCQINAAQAVISKISAPDGYSPLGVPSIEPLFVKELRIKQGDDSPVKIDLMIKNGDMYGFSKSKFTKLQGFGGEPDGKYEVNMKIPQISLLSNYGITGQVLIVPIQGEGKCNLTLDNIAAVAKFTGKSITKNGKEYMEIEKFKLSFTTTRLYMHFENLFNGNKALGEGTNAFLNQSWEDIFKEIRKNLFDAVGKILESYIATIFIRVPYKELFLPN